MTKHRNIKLMFKLVILFFIPLLLSAGQNYTVQIAATKSPVDLSVFAQRKQINHEIFEYKDSLWYRYFVGNFQSFRSADSLSVQLLQTSLLKNVFITELPESFAGMGKLQGLTDTKTVTADSIIQQKDSSEEKVVAEKILLDTKQKNSKNGETPAKIPGIHNRLINYVNKEILADIISFIEGNGEEIEGVSLGFIFILFVLIFVVNIFIVLFIFVFSNSIQNKNIRNKELSRGQYESALLSYVLGELNWDDTKKKLKNLDNQQNRELLSSILINFHENLKGSANDIIPEIFVKLGLHHDALKQTKSKYFFMKVKGIRKLTLLYPEGATEIIPELINHSDDVIRAEAQTAYIRLNPENPFDFLRFLKKPFTRWSQISTFYVFKLHQLPVPSFVKYLESTHQNVRNFALRMIIYFQQLENTQDILAMLDSESEQTRTLAIKAVNDLRISEGRKQLRTLYDVEKEKNKIEIIKAYRNIGDSDDFEFLESIIKAENITLRIEACRSLYYMSMQGKEKLLHINNEMKNGLDIYIAHINDPRN